MYTFHCVTNFEEMLEKFRLFSGVGGKCESMILLKCCVLATN